MLTLSLKADLFQEKDFEEMVKEELNDMILEMMLKGMEKFIQTADQLIPVLTGQAKGVLQDIIDTLELSSHVDYQNPIAQTLIDRPGMLTYLLGRGQTPEAGAAQTTTILQELDDLIVFNINTTVPYFGRWDDTRWNSFQEGFESMRDHVETLDPELYFDLNLEDFFNEVELVRG